MVLNLRKVAVATAVSGLILLGSQANAFAAADATAEVVGDGDSFSYSNDSDELAVDNSQFGHVSNLDIGAGVSGFNKQSGGDDENSMTTGNADGFGGSDNFLNSNYSFIADSEADSAVASATTGEDGDADAFAYDIDSVKVDNDNKGFIENFTLGAAISGFNQQSWNDDGNDTTTGDSTAEAYAFNQLNSNWTWIEGGHSAHATASVGDDGKSYAKANDSDEIRVYNDNFSFVGNASLAFAVSGGNSQSKNDDDNSIDTGASSASSTAANFVNSNVTVIGSEEGAAGSAVASATTGEDGKAKSKSEDIDSVKVDNDNAAKVENVSVAAGVSGGNTQSHNDDGNTMTTGSASGSSCSTNTVNSNWTVIGGSLPEGEETVGCSQ